MRFVRGVTDLRLQMTPQVRALEEKNYALAFAVVCVNGQK